MKLQHQTTFGGAHHEPRSERGNCWSTCVACILGLDTRTVPNFCGEGEDDGVWFEEANHWLYQRGLLLMGFNTDPITWGRCYRATISIASGLSPRGHSHSVLWQGGKLLHDPHPSGAGIAEPKAWQIVVVSDLDKVMRRSRSEAERIGGGR